MDSKRQKSIVEMARGAVLERIDYEMPKIMANILDANTKATAKRKLTLTIELVPNDEREFIVVSYVVKSALAPSNPMHTSLYVTGSEMTGEMNVVEMVAQAPGQMSMDGEVQATPPVLRLINNF